MRPARQSSPPSLKNAVSFHRPPSGPVWGGRPFPPCGGHKPPDGQLRKSDTPPGKPAPRARPPLTPPHPPLAAAGSAAAGQPATRLGPGAGRMSGFRTFPGIPMRLSRFHLHTTKETPADAELVSHKLMLRAGMIRKLAAGLYTWTPLGLRVLRKVEAVVREEMDRAGAVELQLPTIQPRELWEETGRWEKFGGQLLKIKDRKEAEYCFSPTAEEAITDFARQELSSYKQLPVNF